MFFKTTSPDVLLSKKETNFGHFLEDFNTKKDGAVFAIRQI